MGTSNGQVRLFNVLPDEEFLARHAEVQQLFYAGLDVARSLQPSCFLSGKRKSGKSEILKRTYNRLFWEQERVVPFFHSLPKAILSAETLCREYFFRSVLEYIAFLRKDAGLILTEEFDLNRIVRLAYESKLSWLIDSVDQFHAFGKNRDQQALARLAIHFPATAALRSGLHAFVLIDDFHYIASVTEPEDLGLLIREFVQVLESRQAPHCLAGAPEPMFKTLFNMAEFPGNVEVLPLSPLKSQEALNLFEGLCRRFEVEFEPALSRFVVEQLDFNLFYVRVLVQAARRESLGIRTARAFADLYSRELTQGNLQLYFSSLIHSASLSSQERIRALEFLHFCTRAPMEFSALHYLTSRETVETIDLEKVLSALGAIGLIDYGLGVATSIQDPVLRDWIVWNFRHKIEGAEMQRTSFELHSSLLKRFERVQQSRQQTVFFEQLRELLQQMNCQSVSQILLHYDQFAAHEELKDATSQAAFLSRQGELVLPEIVSVTTWRGGLRASEGAGLLLIGRGFERHAYTDETEISWIAGCVAPAVAGLDEIQNFYQRCESVKSEEGLKRVKLWLVAEGKFNQAALSFAESHDILTSNSEQLKRLRQLLSHKEPDILELDDPEQLLTFEMTIPMAADTELVAVRALEQAVEDTSFDEKSKGQIRMALMEACINIKESVVSQTGKIHMLFKTGTDRLIIEMHVEGRSVESDPVKAWGMKMLQSLMDEVRLTHTPQGLGLVMTKYLRNLKKEAV